MEEPPSEITNQSDGGGDNLNPKPPSPPPRRRTKSRIQPPYPWSTNHRARIHNLTHLQSNQINTITGDVKCIECGKEYKIEYDLLKKFNEISSFIEKNKANFQDRAPSSWWAPVLPNCEMCNQQNCVEPVIPGNDNKSINWLFLLLGQLLGRLKLGQIKYFCAHTKITRTGPKNCLLYRTYLDLCKQLQPSNTFFDP